MLKSVLQKCIYRLFAKTAEGAISRLEGKSVVSFDVFDTLIRRETERPRDLFALLEKQLLLAGERRAEGFAALRINAEETARRQHPKREVTLAEIYSAMPVDRSLREAWKAAECQLEIGISTPDLSMKRVYDVCIAQKKTVYFISDMYLPAETVWTILDKNGYRDGKLYISSESGRKKRGGELFAFIRDREGIDERGWCHIGDSILSDYLMAKRLGIRSVLTARERRHNPYVDRRFMRSSPAYRQIGHFIDVHVDRCKGPYERIGYAVTGPLLYCFSKWLECELPADEKAVFLAREGRLLQRAFKIVAGRDETYFYVSRRAAGNAYLGIADSSAEASQRKYRTILKRYTAEQLALGYGLTSEEARAVFSEERIDPEAIVESGEAEERIAAAVWPIVRRRGAEQHALLQRYMDQLELTEKCALVDVGWLGTIQLLLEKGKYTCAGAPILWSGHYIAINRNSQGPNIHSENRRAFLYTDGMLLSRTQKRIRDSVVATVAFLEMLLMSTEGTTLSYRTDGEDKVCAVLDESDNGGQTDHIIASMQAAALSFVEDYARSPASLLAETDAAAAIGNYIALAARPSRRTLTLFRAFGYRDGGSRQTFVCSHSLGYYLRRPKVLAKEFFNSMCKAWFLKSLIKLPLPYVWLTSVLRSVFAGRRMKE